MRHNLPPRNCRPVHLSWGVYMKIRLMLGCLWALLPSFSLAQVPAAELAKPPADARHYIIQSTGGKHGDSWS